MAYTAMRRAGLVPAAAPDLRTVALYVRVSTGYQVDKDSLPFQKKELKTTVNTFYIFRRTVSRFLRMPENPERIRSGQRLNA